MVLKKRLENVEERIHQAALKCSRDPESIHLVAVTKTITVDSVRDAIEAGVTILGENYVQEARNKFNVLGRYPVSWHFIGHLQSNKAKYAVRLFDLIHSVDTLKLAGELNKQAKKVNKVQDILIQINIGKEPSKFGSDIENAANLIEHIVLFENLSVKGFMAMPPFYNNPEKARPYFIALRNLRDQIQKAFPDVGLNELSMGMTGDFEVAIEEGATLVRIGTAVFGERG
ncbi:MAG: YggS family pyridoxal phosphate-dependent enzyme [Desulfobacteraceae bacterium]|nr:YggS family pyridoxal phosphate-dependent enzyme [Desulfobacteraceae bacterium]